MFFLCSGKVYMYISYFKTFFFILGGLGMFVFTGLEPIKSISVNNGENLFDIQVD